MCEASKALLCTGHPPARVRQISGFAKISACVFYEDCGFHAYDYAAFGRRACLRIVAGKSKEAV